MIYGQIKGLGKSISRVIMGGADLRTDRRAHEDCMKLYDAAYENGINTFDTAVIYGDSECVLGEWIAERRKREPDLLDKLVLITKGAHYNAYRKRLTPFDILSDIHESFAKSKLEHFDIYLMHRDDPEFPVAPIIDTLNRLRDRGKIKIFGVSNWAHSRIEQANNYALKHHLEPIRVSSPNFTLGRLNKPFFQGDDVSLCGDEEALAWYQAEQMPVFAYSSLARGFYTGLVKSGAPPDESQKYLHEVMANEHNFKILAELEQARGFTVMQAALKRLTEQPFPVYPIFATSKPGRIAEAARAFN